MALCIRVKEYEFIMIGDVRISMRKDSGRTIRIWIEAPPTTPIKREKHGAGTGS